MILISFVVEALIKLLPKKTKKCSGHVRKLPVTCDWAMFFPYPPMVDLDDVRDKSLAFLGVVLEGFLVPFMGVVGLDADGV